MFASSDSVLRLLVSIAILLGGGLFRVSPATGQTSSSPAPDSTFAQVDRLRRNGNFDDALARLRALEDQYGENVDILWRMSLTRIDSAKSTSDEQAVDTLYREALALADRALEADSLDAHAHQAKAIAEGRIALDAGRKERVQRSRTVKHHADRAIELDSTLDGAYHVRARWHREVADLGFLQRVVVKAVYGGLPEASIEHAVRDFRRAIELHDERLHRLELAKTYLKLDREEEAKAELRALLELPPRGPFDEGYGLQAQQLLKGME